MCLFHVNNDVRAAAENKITHKQQQYRAVKTQLVRQMYMKAASKAGDVLALTERSRVHDGCLVCPFG